MKASEKFLMIAVRDRLRTEWPYKPGECDVDLDEDTPATIGQLYVGVLPGGWQPARWHNTCGGVNDLLYGVKVMVIRRISNVPKDRRVDVFLRDFGNLADEMDRIYQSIDFNYLVNDRANELITAETGSTEGFVEPLKFVSIEERPRVAPAEIFGGSRDPAAGLMRTISFFGARRLTHK